MAELHEELKKIRENRGITQTQIVEKIKIRADFLERLESGDLTFVPMPFVRGFIREYAKVIGIEPDLALQKLDNKISTLLTEEIETDTNAAPEKTVRTEKTESPDTPADTKESELSQAGDTSGTETETEDEASEPPGPQTSLFDEPSNDAEPESEEYGEVPAAPEEQDNTPEKPLTVSEPEAIEETTTPVPDDEDSVQENIPAISPEAQLAPAEETGDSAVPQVPEELPEEMEQRAPLNIKETESTGNVAFFIFIAVLIVLAVVILLMNRGSLF